MSFLLDGPLLLGLGHLVALAARNNPRRHWLPHILGALILGVFYATSVAAFTDMDWIRPLLVPPFVFGNPTSGTDWMVNSGVFHFQVSWPPGKTVTFLAILGFVSYPFWLYLGFWNGQNLFGRNPKQSGLIGLLKV
ncbi:MAG: hypothetical protein HY558_01615 [Euryarchaeota archaeon]|nr:hypothetical protein [Euryarchaeota archaeon]